MSASPSTSSLQPRSARWRSAEVAARGLGGSLGALAAVGSMLWPVSAVGSGDAMGRWWGELHVLGRD
jgi:hypothetical protein